jgi:hypothetical protein
VSNNEQTRRLVAEQKWAKQSLPLPLVGGADKMAGRQAGGTTTTSQCADIRQGSSLATGHRPDVESSFWLLEGSGWIGRSSLGLQVETVGRQ